MKNIIGKHLIVEMIGCKKNLDNFPGIKKVLSESAIVTNSTLVNIEIHKFPYQDTFGISGIAVLLESHISIHTWAEYSYAAIDIFTCGSHTDPFKAIPILSNFFNPDQIIIKNLDRGF